MGTFIIIVLVGIFLYWSLVPARPRQPTLNDIINDGQRQTGQFSNVYESQLVIRVLGRGAFGAYYISVEPKEPEDRIIYSGTTNECEVFLSKRNYH